MGSATTAQLNVRMDSGLRAAGDAVLERVGVAPVDLVRALWAKIGRSVQDCEQVLSVLVDEDEPSDSSRGDTFLAQVEGWHAELFALAGVDRASYVAPTDEELGEMLYDEWLRGDAKEAVS